MSMLTCCPTCDTVFKVVPDQLRISQGWVRCGNCSEIFDASAHLQERQPAPGAPLTGLASHPRATAPAGSDLPHSETREAAEAALLAEALAFAGRTPPAASAFEEGYPAFTLLRADDVTPVREGDSGPARDPAADTAPPSVPGGDAAPASLPASAATAARDLDELGDLGDFAQPLPPTFVQEARRRAVWHRPGVRVALVLAGLLLAVLLVGQYALHDRDRLAARSPALAGPLQALCRLAGCTVQAPRLIDAIAIDSSTFTKLRPDGYRLALTLKNTAAHPVAMPAVELTLTDSQDQAVLRRVLLPADFGARSQVLPASADWSGALALTVLPAGNPARVSGYRVLAFYP